MQYFTLTGKEKEVLGIIRYDAQRESTEIWRKGSWIVNNNLFSFVMGEGSAQPVSEKEALLLIEEGKY